MKPTEMGASSLKALLNSITPISEDEWEDFSHHHMERSLRNKAFLLREGQVCRHLIFLKSGLIRSFSLLDGKEFTSNFYKPGSLFYDDYSFISQKPGRKSFQALEASEVILIPREHLMTMFDRYKCFERIGRISIENAHIKMIEARERLVQNSAEENYKLLLETNPDLIHTVSQKIIASYLNVSSEHLSRIRLKLSSG